MAAHGRGVQHYIKQISHSAYGPSTDKMCRCLSEGGRDNHRLYPLANICMHAKQRIQHHSMTWRCVEETRTPRFGHLPIEALEECMELLPGGITLRVCELPKEPLHCARSVGGRG